VARGPVAAAVSADVAVIGAGLIGLSAAMALADQGLQVLLVGEPRAGEASPAGAGMLAPSLHDTNPGVAGDPMYRFAVASLARYPGYLQSLAERSGIAVPLNRRGILRLAIRDSDADGLRARRGPDAQWLDAAAVAAIEPGLAPVAGAMFYPADGAVDNLALLRALDAAIARSPRIRRMRSVVRTIAIGPTDVSFETVGPVATARASHLVLAAGAWSTGIGGLPRALPIEPYRGQMFSVAATGTATLQHVVYGPEAYLVPRGDRVLVGATMERAGFDAATTDDALASIRSGAAAFWPVVRAAAMMSSWAGLRPVTPDLLPILGRDPDHPALIYACGHSRNGILMAPLTGDCVAALVTGTAPPADLSAFAVERFSRPT
jgi:glycine oxidase